MLAPESHDSGLLEKLKTRPEMVALYRAAMPIWEWVISDANGREIVPKRLFKKKGLDWRDYQESQTMIFLPEEKHLIQGYLDSGEPDGKVIRIAEYVKRRPE